MTFGKDITYYGCGCKKESAERFGVDKEYHVSYPCFDCQQKMIGTRQTVVRYGGCPQSGYSKNYRDNVNEIGISCYLTTMRPRPEFTSRKKHIFSAIIIGWGSDDEPIIDAKTIIK
jgi:hypothetical protein